MKAPKVPRLRFRVKCLKSSKYIKVPSKGSKQRFRVKVPKVPSEGSEVAGKVSEGFEVPSNCSVSSVQKVPSLRVQVKVPKVPSEGSEVPSKGSE